MTTEALPMIVRTPDDVIAYLKAGYCLVVEEDLPARTVGKEERPEQKAQAFLVEGMLDRGYTRGNVPVPIEAVVIPETSGIRQLEPAEMARRCRALHLHREPKVLSL